MIAYDILSQLNAQKSPYKVRFGIIVNLAASLQEVSDPRIAILKNSNIFVWIQDTFLWRNQSQDNQSGQINLPDRRDL